MLPMLRQAFIRAFKKCIFVFSTNAFVKLFVLLARVSRECSGLKSFTYERLYFTERVPLSKPFKFVHYSIPK